MGFRNNAYATVWSVEPRGNITNVRISTSRKNKDTGAYTDDFSGFCTFIGEAHRNAASLKERDRIRIDECEVTTTYNKEKKITYTNFNVYGFSSADGTASKPAAAPTPKRRVPIDDDSLPEFEGDVDDEDVPF